MQQSSSDAWLATLQQQLLAKGFDICAPFPVSAYNTLVSRKNAAHRLPDFNRNRALGVIIGSSRAFWPSFVEWLRTHSSFPKDPVDTYCTTVIEETVAAVPVTKHFGHSHYLPHSGRFVHMQTAGHVAGVAYYYPALFWSVHPKFGLWFVYRAVVVFDADFAGPDPALPEALLTPEQEAIILRLNEEAFSGKNPDAYFQARCVYQVAEELHYDGDIKDLFCYHKTDVLRRLHATK